MTASVGAFGLSAEASAEPPVGQLVGSIEAVVFVCTPIDPKSAKTGLEVLRKTTAQYKLDLPTVRASDDYKSVYDAEVNRLLVLPLKDRLRVCQTAW